MKRYARILAAAVVVGAVCAAPSARADEEPVAAGSADDAREQYKLGTKAFKDKHYSEAALHFEAAAAFRPHAVALYTAGLAWDLATRLERAADAYARALKVPGLDPKQTEKATERLAELEKTLGTLDVTAPEGWKVQLDTLTEVPAPARLHASPGMHTLSVRAPGEAIERRDVSLETGQVTELELKDEPEPVAEPEPEPEPEPVKPAPPPQAPEFWTTRRAVGLGVGGAGIAALGAGIVLGLSANGARDAYNAAPTREGFDHANGLATWTTVALISGAVLVAGGVALVVIPDKERAEARLQASVVPGGLVLGGAF